MYRKSWVVVTAQLVSMGGTAWNRDARVERVAVLPVARWGLGRKVNGSKTAVDREERVVRALPLGFSFGVCI